MKVKVRSCWNGHNIYYQLDIPGKHPFSGKKLYYKELIQFDSWNKKTAKEALDLLETHYGMNRRNIRFDHV